MRKGVQTAERRGGEIEDTMGDNQEVSGELV